MYRRWLSEVWGQGRTDVARELVAEDLVDHNPYPGQPPGLEGHNWAVAMVRRAFPDLRFTADVVVAEGQFVAGRWTMTGTNTGTFDLFGLPPTGRPVTMTGQEISGPTVASSLRCGIKKTPRGCCGRWGWSPRRPSCGSPPGAAHAATGERAPPPGEAATKESDSAGPPPGR